MRTITVTELKKNHNKYFQLAETEEIEVTKKGEVIFTMIPNRKRLGEHLKAFFGILPGEASIGKDPDERG